MTAAQIRQSFLDFFAEKNHTIVRSDSLLPSSPNLLFTNAGMNQFVPIFLGEQEPKLSTWPSLIAGVDRRAADTQKCIRAGGKHNDLDDVGMDLYHHTFFEMLGNWSFGDYFKEEAIRWAWELVVERWGLPPQRLYATIYQPEAGDPSERDEESASIWAELFRGAGLDPAVHIVNGGKKDNFWMMGETGPCGPCSELHVDLTPQGNTQGRLVNAGDASCMEIWNLVFIQLNANADGSFSALPEKHVDTGMGLERVASIAQGSDGFQDFSTARFSNYNTDLFAPLFAKISELSGQKYHGTLPSPAGTLEEKRDVAFRVIADHARTLSFAIGDGIAPGNNDRNYVLRRILRRATRYGRNLGLEEPFLHRLAPVLAEQMGGVFPELREKLDHIQSTLLREEEAFIRTLDKGLSLFDEQAQLLKEKNETVVPGDFVFRLYDEQGFPDDLTEVLARERGLRIDQAGFEERMDAQRARARAAQKKVVVEASKVETTMPTEFIGYDEFQCDAKLLEVVEGGERTGLVFDQTPFYAEMGGQLGDQGNIQIGDRTVSVKEVRQSGVARVHWVDASFSEQPGVSLNLLVDQDRRLDISRHHTVTHLLHWALHEVVSSSAVQKGSYVGPEKLTFDFESAALSETQVREVERLVNDKILQCEPVFWEERPYSEIKDHPGVLQFFGDKYGDRVRVVQIGGERGQLNGFSMELCGGTHTRWAGELGAFTIVHESAVAAGIRRIEAVTGRAALQRSSDESARLQTLAQMLQAPLPDVEKKVQQLLERQKGLEQEIEKARRGRAQQIARELVNEASIHAGIPLICVKLEPMSGDDLGALGDSLMSQFEGIAFLAVDQGERLDLLIRVGSAYQSIHPAGNLMRLIAAETQGKGGGRPEAARGSGTLVSGYDAAVLSLHNSLGQSSDFEKKDKKKKKNK